MVRGEGGDFGIQWPLKVPNLFLVDGDETAHASNKGPFQVSLKGALVMRDPDQDKNPRQNSKYDPTCLSRIGRIGDLSPVRLVA